MTPFSDDDSADRIALLMYKHSSSTDIDRYEIFRRPLFPKLQANSWGGLLHSKAQHTS